MIVLFSTGWWIPHAIPQRDLNALSDALWSPNPGVVVNTRDGAEIPQVRSGQHEQISPASAWHTHVRFMVFFLFNSCCFCRFLGGCLFSRMEASQVLAVREQYCGETCDNTGDILLRTE